MKGKLKEEENAKRQNKEKKKSEKFKKTENVTKNKKGQNNLSVCAKCKTVDGNDIYVCCELCSSIYHANCSGIDFTDVHQDDIVSFPLECDNCL